MLAKLWEKRHDRRMWLLLVLLIVPSLLILAVLLRGLAYQVIAVPILYIVWLVDFFLDALPQALLWLLLVVFLLRLAWRSLMPKKRAVHASHTDVRGPTEGQVRVWARRLALVQQGDYSRWGFSRHVFALTADVLAHRDSITLVESRERIRTGRCSAPPEVTAYLQAATLPQLSYGVPFFRRLLQRLGLKRAVEPSALNLDIERVVEFLEEQLEVPHENH